MVVLIFSSPPQTDTCERLVKREKRLCTLHVQRFGRLARDLCGWAGKYFVSTLAVNKELFETAIFTA